ncbi:MAG: VIT domain-containing protein [Planctomycetota bacterium]
MPTSAPTCGQLVTADGRTLPLQQTRLVVRAAGGMASVRLVQTFANPHREPLHVRYQLPLPADAAVGGFSFRLGDQVVQGVIDGRSRARERFEQAIASGRTAALLEQDRSSVFSQELGNLPPGAEVEATITLDQPLQWLDDGWQWRFPTTVAPRYLGAAGRVADADTLAVDVVEPATALPARCELELLVADPLPDGVLPESPSHALHTAPAALGTRVAFAAGGGREAMDRDVVVHWRTAAPEVGVALQTVLLGDGPLTGQAFGLLTIVPPRNALGAPRLGRDLIVLLDISGSMHGAPLAQAQAVTEALVQSLGDEDRLELIAFASRPEAWQPRAAAATAANKRAAVQWLRSLRAGGGTEMHEAILAALAATRDGVQRQVVVVTDGLIGFEQEIVAAIHRGLPAHSRVHVVGVGSATNRTLTRGASRAGRGLEVLIGIDDEPTTAAQRLLARTSAPLLDELSVDGSAVLGRAPAALPDLFAGAPVRVWLRLAATGGTVRVAASGPGGAFSQQLVVPPLVADGDAAIARAFAREAVEDLEVELAAGAEPRSIDARIEQLGLSHGISTRLTSWVAIAAAATVDPRAPQRRELVPQQLPHGMSVAQLGLRGMPMAMPCAAEETAMDLCMPRPAAPMPGRAAAKGRRRSLHDADDEKEAMSPVPPSEPVKAKKSLFGRLFGKRGGEPRESAAGGPPPVRRATLRLRAAGEWLLELSGFVAWQLPDKVVLVDADGREREVLVDRTRTTAAAAVAAGSLVRLVVSLPAGDGLSLQPASLRLTIGGETLEVPFA